MDIAVLAFGLFVFVAHLLEVVFRRIRIPDILLLMLLGIIAGPVAGWVPIEELRLLGQFLGVATLVVILFESGLNLKASELLSGAKRAVPFALTTFIFTLAALIVGAKYLLDIPWATAVLSLWLPAGLSPSYL